MAQLSTYISFDNAKEAIEYYENFFLAKDSFRMPIENEEMAKSMGYTGNIENSTMHGGFFIHGNLVLCSDRMKYKEDKITRAMSLIFDYNSEDEEEVKMMEELYNSIIKADGITIDLPLAEQFWGGKMGSVIDKFGVSWMLHSQPYSKK